MGAFVYGSSVANGGFHVTGIALASNGGGQMRMLNCKD
jgi:hypothetical protein